MHFNLHTRSESYPHKRLLLAAVATVACPFVLGVVSTNAQTRSTASAPPRFEVASVRASNASTLRTATRRDWGEVTGRVTLDHIPLKYVLLKVYNLRPEQLSGPEWLGADCFDILATAPADVPKEQIPLMFQGLLAERFKLRFHRESRMMPVYALLVAEGGPKLKEAVPDDGTDGPAKMSDGGISGTVRGPYGKIKMTSSNAGLHNEFLSVTPNGLAEYLSGGILDLPVIDKTGLSGSYAVTLDIPMSEMRVARGAISGEQADSGQPAALASEPTGFSIGSSLKRQGLKLVRQRAPVEKFVIDHVERTPIEN